MPKVSRVYSSRFVQAVELQRDARKRVMITAVGEQAVGADRTMKIVLTLDDGAGWSRDLVANQTNCRAIAAAHGDEADDWLGEELDLWVEDVEFRGSTVLSVRAAPVAPDPVEAAATKAVKKKALPGPVNDLDDDVPF